jgi:23S rRNA G2445 N2-methylase RlmL
MQLIATCPEETKPALLLELEALGARSIAPGYRAVIFEASDALLYELHLKLRTASRTSSTHLLG